MCSIFFLPHVNLGNYTTISKIYSATLEDVINQIAVISHFIKDINSSLQENMKKQYRVLMIGQLPTEVGGHYTTGIAKVVYELSKQTIEGYKFFTYATNINKRNAKKICTFPLQYMGYSYHILRMLYNIIFHPVNTYRQWKIYKKELRKNPLRFEFYKANFQNVIEAVKPDIIHMHGDGLVPLYFARGKKNIPILYTCHGVFDRYINPTSPAKKYADRVSGLTDETLWEIQHYYCVDPSKINIIPNGVDCHKFYFSEKDRIRIRHEMNVSDNTMVFITVASVQPRKGQFDFIKLIEKLDIDCQYWIIGLGEDIDKIKSYATEKGIEDRVKILGYKNSDELYKYYSASDIYAHVSTMEGQALCEIEAYATGLRTLVRNLIKATIASEELSNGDYIFVNFDNPDYDSLKQWITSPNTIIRQSRTNLDWPSVAMKYCDYYNKVLK